MFEPSSETLTKYAEVLVNFALNSGEGIKPGEVVQVLLPDVAKPMLLPLQATILKAGGHPLMRFLPTGVDRQFYELANDEQLTFFPKSYVRSRINLIDHSIAILADADLHELQGIPAQKIFKSQKSKQKAREWLNDKEAVGKFTWTLALYGTPAMAKEAGLSLEEYWHEIIQACYLDVADPIQTWKMTYEEINAIRDWLNQLPIDKIHVVGEKTDLWLTLGQHRRFLSGSGRNIPSFEIFTSPDWRGTNGYVYFNQPLYRYGSLIKDVRLEFKNGKVTKAQASSNQELLAEMIAQENADKVGEFSLTDSRHSRITKFMANTLFDENMGGQFGNTHIALGMSYKDTFDGNVALVKKKDLDQWGFNDIYCSVHTDIVSTQDRTVTVILKNGKKQVIYKDGMFCNT